MIDQQKASVYEFSSYRIDEDERLLKRNGDVISLPPKVIDLLLVLLRSGGRVLTKNELMESVWADSFVEETNLTHNISILRRVFDEKRSGEKFIETIPRRGYRFVADVKVAGNDEFEVIALERTDTRVVVEEEADTGYDEPNLTPARRSRTVLAVGAGVAILVLLFAAGYLLPRDAGVKAYQFSEAGRITSEGNPKLACISPDGKFAAYVTDRDRRFTLWVRNISTRSSVPIYSDSEKPITSVRFGPSDRIYFVMSDAIYHIPMLGGPIQKVVAIAAGAAFHSFTFSPDWKQIAFMRANADSSVSPIIISDVDGGNERVLASSTNPALFLRSPDWSPDGKHIAMVSLTAETFQTISIVNVSDGSVSVLPTTKWYVVEQVEWLPDSSGLLAVVGDGEVWRTEFPAGGGVKVSDNLSRYSSISISADGNSLVATKQESDGHVWLLPIGQESSAVQLTHGFDKSDGGPGIDWLSSDRIRFVTGRSFESWSIDLPRGEPVKMLAASTGMSSLSPDKQFILSQGADENGAGLFRIRIADGESKRLGPGPPVYPRVSPDGKWIVFTQYTEVIAVWKIPFDGGDAVKITNLPGYALNPVVSPDGTRIACVWWESSSADALPKIAIVSFADGSLITALTVPMQWEGEAGRYSKEVVEWTPDGKALDHIQMRNGVSNIWRQPIDGSPASQITFFDSGRIANFAYSPDRKYLALSRGNFASDVFLVTKGE